MNPMRPLSLLVFCVLLSVSAAEVDIRHVAVDPATRRVPSTGIQGHSVFLCDLGARQSRYEDLNGDRPLGLEVRTMGNFPLGSHVDLRLLLGIFGWKQSLDGLDAAGESLNREGWSQRYSDTDEELRWQSILGEAALVLSLRPGTSFNPYLMGGAFGEKTRAQTDHETLYDETETGVLWGAGCELRLGKRMGLSAEYSRRQASDPSETSLNLRLLYWVSDPVALSLTGTRRPETDTASVGAGMIWNF